MTRPRFYVTGETIDIRFDELPLITRKGFGALLVDVEATIKFGDEPQDDWHVDLSSSIACFSYNAETKAHSFIEIERGDEFFNAIVDAITSTQHKAVMAAIDAQEPRYIERISYRGSSLAAMKLAAE